MSFKPELLAALAGVSGFEATTIYETTLPALRGDTEVALAAVKAAGYYSGGDVVRAAPKELRSSAEFMLAAVAICGDASEHASEELRGNAEFMLRLVVQSAKALQYASDELKGNAEFLAAVKPELLAALAREPDGYNACKHYTEAPDALRGDPEVALAALKAAGDFGLGVLRATPEALRNNMEFMLAATMLNEYAPESASKALKANREFVQTVRGFDNTDRAAVLAAMSEDEDEWQFASELLLHGEFLPEKKAELLVMLAVMPDDVIDLYTQAPDALRGDLEVALAALTAAPEFSALQVYKAAPEGLRNNTEFMVAILKDCHNHDMCGVLTAASEALRSDAEFMLAALQAIDAQQGDVSIVLDAASEALRSNADFMISVAAIRDLDCIGPEEYASKALKANREFVQAVKGFDNTDRAAVLAATAEDEVAWQFVSEELKGDAEFLLAAVAQDSKALQCVSEELKGDADFQAAVKKELLAAFAGGATEQYSHGALEFAPVPVKADKEFALAALTAVGDYNYGKSLSYLPDSLQGDMEVVLLGMEMAGRGVGNCLEFVSKELQGNAELVRMAIAQDGCALEFASEELTGNAEIVRMAVAQDGCALEFASEELRGNAEIVRMAVARDGTALQFASECLRGNAELVLVAVAQCGTYHAGEFDYKSVLDLASEELRQDPLLQRLAVLKDDYEDDDLNSDEEGTKDPSARALPHELLRLGLFGHLQYLPSMFDEGITVGMLPVLTDAQLKELGMKIGERVTFLEAVKLSEAVPLETAKAKFASFFTRMGGAAAIQGMEAAPLSSLRETVSFILGDGAPSQVELAASCDEAEAKADELLATGPDEYGLTRDEIAAIHLYTQECVYRPLNRALWSKERGAVKPYWGYIRLLQHGLFKVPKCDAGTIYRGIKDPYEPITEAGMLAKAIEGGGTGEPEVWWGFSSCSTNQQPVMTFLGHDAGVSRVLYTVEGGSSARDVRKYSAYQEEAEVLMPFGSAFTVVTASNPAPNLLLVTLRQTHEFVYGGGGGAVGAMEPEPT